MPYAPARPCRNRSCPSTTTARDGYCDTCRPKVRKAFDSQPHRREHHAFYASKAWRACRAAVLARDPVCKECESALSTIGAHKAPARMMLDLQSSVPLGTSATDAEILKACTLIARGYGHLCKMHGDGVLFWPEGRPRPAGRLFFAELSKLRIGWPFALDEDAVEGWCKPCHDADSGREAHRGRIGRP